MEILKDRFIQNLSELESLPGYRWEIITYKHTEHILRWRNDPDNLSFFEKQIRLTKKVQCEFLKRYNEFDRIDLVLADKHPVGVFNIKNLETLPEYGALIGDRDFRNKGLGFRAKIAIFKYWFTVIDRNEIFIKNKIENKQVVSNNLKLGFKIIGKDSRFITFVLNKEDFYKNIITK